MFRKEVTEKGQMADNLLYIPKGPTEEIGRVETGDRLGHSSLCSIRL